MLKYSGFQLISYSINFDCSFIRCSFVGFRDGCINLEKESLMINVRYCCFIDNCVTGRNGGCVCIVGDNSAAKINFCYATSCYGRPVGSNLSEGQFLFVNWNKPQMSKQNFHEISYLSVLHCAPLFHSSGNGQRAPVYIGGGTKSSNDINISRSISHLFSIFFLELKNGVHNSYLTCFNCSTCGPSIGFLVADSIFTCIAIIHPYSYSDPGGIDFVDYQNFTNNVYLEKSIFIYDKKTTNVVRSQYKATFNSCFFVNLITDTFIITGSDVPTSFTNKPIQELFYEMNIFFSITNSCNYYMHISNMYVTASLVAFFN